MSVAATLIWVDGEQADSLPLPDRGLALGDGLFETLLLLDGRPVFPDYHLERLRRGLARLAFVGSEGLLAAAGRAIEVASAVAGRGVAALRLTLTRGAGPRGYRVPEQVTPRLISELSASPSDPRRWALPIHLGLLSASCSDQPRLAGIKHLNRLDQVLAASECAGQAAWDEGVMLNQQGQVVSAIAANLFALCDGQLLTPALARCGIEGTRRRAVMERWAPALGLPVLVTDLHPAELEQADELFICNALTGVRAVASLGQRQWGAHPLTRALFEQSCEDYRSLTSEAAAQ